MILDLNTEIKNICLNAYRPLEHVFLNGVTPVGPIPIRIGEMDNYLLKDIRECPNSKQLINAVKAVHGPALYWYEVTSDHNADDLLIPFKLYASQKQRAVPALKPNTRWSDSTSRVLYVGKVKNHFWGRVIQHLGFYRQPQTQGLQLYHWAKDLNLHLNVYAIPFQQDMAEFMDIVERGVAQRLKPLIGKHK